MKKPDSSFDLVFPENSGCDNTQINFYCGPCNLDEIYFAGDDSPYPSRLFVTDETIAKLDCMKDFVSKFKESRRGNDTLLILGAGEKYKTIESVLKIVSTALDANYNRNCLFVAIGGGVICDMTGFAASMFKRGVDAEFVPTTLLADVDASIGGKTGCDFSSYKNMIGAFYPAKKIHIWPSFVKTLPEKEFISGLAEAVKTAFLFSKEMCDLLKNNREKVLSRDEKILFKVISECAKAKASIVHEDFKEKGRRAFLNLGHTFGHALESVAGLGKVTHGEGVAWGMGRAIALSEKLGLCTKNFADDCKQILESYGYCTQKQHPAISDRDIDKIISAMHKDKKNSSSRGTKVILQSDWQNTIIREVSDQDIDSVLR